MPTTFTTPKNGNPIKGQTDSLAGPEVKYFLPVFLAVCRDGVLEPDIHIENLMLKMMEQSALVDRILLENGHLPALPRFVGESLVRAVRALNQLVAAVGTSFHEKGVGLFNYTVKSHILDHLALDSMVMNPTWTWCFASEDFLQKLRTLVQASAHGSSPVHVQHVVMAKYLRGFALQLLPDRPLML